MFVKNIIKVCTSLIGIWWIVVWFLCIALPQYFIVDKSTIVLWYGEWYYIWTEVFLWGIIAILFGLFVGATLYKIKYFWTGKKSATGVVGWFLWVIAWGCPACSITFASYLGLAGLVSLLPYKGLELKIISIAFLLYACYITIRDLQVCKLKQKKS